jgi:hypothetical protein
VEQIGGHIPGEKAITKLVPGFICIYIYIIYVHGKKSPSRHNIYPLIKTETSELTIFKVLQILKPIKGFFSVLP